MFIPNQSIWFIKIILIATYTFSFTVNTEFLEPNELEENVHSFTTNGKEYLLINLHVTHAAAGVFCKHTYQGRLVFVKTVELATFLAEALSETNLIMDALWVGGIKKKKAWYWYENEKEQFLINEEIKKYFVDYSTSIPLENRNCLAFNRENHDKPHFPALVCNAQRAMICERNAGRDGSTHPGWIKIGSRLYKIFREYVKWESAEAQCMLYDKDARLAVVVNFPDSQALGRYLLVGRPSLENAWIGAKYENGNYVFNEEQIILSNTTDKNNYPPWQGGAVSKRFGCLVLDRHLSNITLFVETRCDRPRPFVCYKTDLSSKKDRFEDVLIDEFGYRIYYSQLPWNLAKEKCDSYKEKYQAKLAEIRETRISMHLLYAMGQNRSTFDHIWLGGTYNMKLKTWLWDSDRKPIDTEILEWLKNSTYFDNVEQFNTCLNMDRENHITPLHYGTQCDHGQNFVCMFPREMLEQLQQDEEIIDENWYEEQKMKVKQNRQ